MRTRHPDLIGQLTFWSEEPPASPSQSPDSSADSRTPEVESSLSISDLLATYGLHGSSGKTSPVLCRQTEDGALEPSSGRFKNSGMGSPGECWTLSTSDWPNDASVSSLLDALETGDVPPRYFLSPKACAGILRRATKRERALPPVLDEALREVASRLEESPKSPEL